MPTYNPIAFVDRVDNLSLVERNGVIRSLTRKATVLFNTAGATARPSDFTVLSEALKAQDMPAPYSTLANMGYDNLVLVERAPSVANNEPCCVDVILKYEHILEGPNQSLYSPTTGIIYGKGRSSVVEKTTNFYQPYGDTNAPRTLILTAHTFNPDKENAAGLAGQFAWPQFPYTIIQGGEITIPFPQSNFKLVGYLDTDNPWVVVRKFIACINSKTWVGYPPLTWLCSEVDFEVMDNKSNNEVTGMQPLQRYKFGFEFQYNFDTWDPRVAFNDQRTGRPPADLEPATQPDPNLPTQYQTFNSYTYNFFAVQGGPTGLQPAGYWNVPCLRRADFDTLFGAEFEQ